jgi:hypothetical protein
MEFIIKRVQKSAASSPYSSLSSYSFSSSYAQVLRTLLKQKEEIADKQAKEIEQLRHLLSRQQRLLNELNEDNMTLQRSLSELRSKESCCSGSGSGSGSSSSSGGGMSQSATSYSNTNKDKVRLTSDE